MRDVPEPVPARFVARPNRFVVVAELENGRRVDAYLPNTGRLEHLTTSGRRLILRRDGVPRRTTQYTAARAWDGTWVALEASRAPRLLTDWLAEGHDFPGWGVVSAIDTEVTTMGHRLDLRLGTAAGPLWVEVKSGGRAADRTGLLSKTPSSRGVAHLDTLGRLSTAGEPAAVAFVLQRGDIGALHVGGDADPAWIAAVERAAVAGVLVTAFRCRVSTTSVAVAGPIPVTWERVRQPRT